MCSEERDDLQKKGREEFGAGRVFLLGVVRGVRAPRIQRER